MPLSLPQKVRLSFLASLIFIAVISSLSYASIMLLIENTNEVQQTHEKIIYLRRLLSQIRSAETAQRGYLLSSSSEFLDRYRGTEKTVWSAYQELWAGLADKPDQRENLEELAVLINQRFKYLDDAINLHDQGESYDLFASTQVMMDVEAVINRMQEEEEALLNTWKENEGLYARRAPFLILMLLLSNLLLMGIAYVRIRKDIGKRAEAEEELEISNFRLERQVEERTAEIRNNEQRYRFMAESIPHIVWTANASGEMDYFNQKLAEYTGWSTEEVLGTKWMQIVHPEDMNHTMNVWSRAILHEQEDRIEHRIMGKDGTYYWMLSHAVPYKNENGRVVKWFGTTTRIDEEKRAKELAGRQEEQLRKITDALPVLISYIDADLHYRFVNKTYEDWFELSREQMLNRRVYDIIGEKGYEAVRPVLDRSLKGESVNEEIKIHYQTKGDRYMKFNTIPHLQHGKVIGVYVLGSDITAEKEAEETLHDILLETETKNQELKRINQILDDFVSMAAHDLKSPVSNLKLSVLLINKLDSAEEKLRVISYLENSVQRLDNTLRGLLEILEVQHVKDASVYQCSFEEILQETRLNLREKLIGAEAKLVSHFDEALHIHYIRPYLLSIFHNLISNAAKYRMPGRPLLLEISSFKHQEGVVLEFKDNGIGMDLTKIGDKLYKPFKRFSSQAEGTGVGLHLIKSMIEKNGGHIKVQSCPGDGTVFRIYLKNMALKSEIE